MADSSVSPEPEALELLSLSSSELFALAGFFDALRSGKFKRAEATIAKLLTAPTTTETQGFRSSVLACQRMLLDHQSRYYLSKGNSLLIARKYSRALNAYNHINEDRAQQLDSSHCYQLYSNRGAALVRLGQVEKGLVALQTAMRIQPSTAATLNVAFAMLSAAKYKESMSLLKDLQQQNKRSSGSAAFAICSDLAMAYCFCQLNRLLEAEDLFNALPPTLPQEGTVNLQKLHLLVQRVIDRRRMYFREATSVLRSPPKVRKTTMAAARHALAKKRDLTILPWMPPAEKRANSKEPISCKSPSPVVSTITEEQKSPAPKPLAIESPPPDHTPSQTPNPATLTRPNAGAGSPSPIVPPMPPNSSGSSLSSAVTTADSPPAYLPQPARSHQHPERTVENTQGANNGSHANALAPVRRIIKEVIKWNSPFLPRASRPPSQVAAVQLPLAYYSEPSSHSATASPIANPLHQKWIQSSKAVTKPSIMPDPRSTAPATYPSQPTNPPHSLPSPPFPHIQHQHHSATVIAPKVSIIGASAKPRRHQLRFRSYSSLNIDVDELQLELPAVSTLNTIRPTSQFSPHRRTHSMDNSRGLLSLCTRPRHESRGHETPPPHMPNKRTARESGSPLYRTSSHDPPITSTRSIEWDKTLHIPDWNEHGPNGASTPHVHVIPGSTLLLQGSSAFRQRPQLHSPVDCGSPTSPRFPNSPSFRNSPSIRNSPVPSQGSPFSTAGSPPEGRGGRVGSHPSTKHGYSPPSKAVNEAAHSNHAVHRPQQPGRENPASIPVLQSRSQSESNSLLDLSPGLALEHPVNVPDFFSVAKVTDLPRDSKEFKLPHPIPFDLPSPASSVNSKTGFAHRQAATMTVPVLSFSPTTSVTFEAPQSSKFVASRASQVSTRTGRQELPIYPWERLKAPGPYPEDVDVAHREQHLCDDDFKQHLGVSREAFAQLSSWKQISLKKAAALF